MQNVLFKRVAGKQLIVNGDIVVVDQQINDDPHLVVLVLFGEAEGAQFSPLGDFKALGGHIVAISGFLFVFFLN